MIRTTKKLVVMIVLAACCGSIWAGTGEGISNVFTIDNTNTDVDAPIVTGIFSQYCSYSGHVYFLSDVSLNQEFTANIEWNGKTPSQVKWYRNNIVITTDSMSGNSISRTFNVGTVLNVGEKLYVQAIASDGTTSAKVAANFDVVSSPPGLNGILTFQSGKYKSSKFQIALPELSKDSPPTEEDNKLAEIAQIAFISILDVTAEVDLNGHADIKSSNASVSVEDFELAGFNMDGGFNSQA